MKISRSDPRPNPTQNLTAFVLSSGHNMGALQVGMLRSLLEHDIRADLVVGCSVGALNGAAFAEEPTLDHIATIERIWRTVDGKGLMPPRWMPSSAMALARRSEAIQGSDGLRIFLDRALTARRFEELKLPFHCVATDVLDATERWFDQGDLIDALLASASMPVVYPSTEIDGRRYIDGAVLNDIPVSRAVELGARTLYVLDVGTLARPWTEPRRPALAVLEAFLIARRHRFARTLAALPDDVTVHMLLPGDVPDVPLQDFSQGHRLIRAGYKAANLYLDSL